MLCRRKVGGLGGYGPLLHASAVVLVWTLGSGALWFVLPQVAFGIVGNVAVVGLLLAVPSLVAAFFDLPVGDLTDRVGERRVLSFGLIALAFLGLGIVFLGNAIGLAFFLVLLGAFYPMIYVPIMSYVMGISPNRKSSEYLGVEMSFLHGGFALGPVILGLLLYLGYGMLGVVSALFTVCSVSALILVTAWFKERGRGESLAHGVRDVVVKDGLFLKELLDYRKLKSAGSAILAVTFLFTFYDGAVWLLVPLYYGMFTPDPLVGGIIMSSFVLPLVLFEFHGGWLADRFGRRNMLVLGMAAAGVFTVAFSLATDVTGLFVAGFLATCGLALAWPSVQGVLAVKSGSEGRSGIVGVWSSSRDFGYMVGPIGAGVLGGLVGLSGVFAALGVLLLASIGLALFVEE
ncbi:MAG: MFS transporter [Candidatus Altiarchaeota archaeon]